MKGLDAREIVILSGEGTGGGFAEVYKGKRTSRAIKLRLTKERCGGDRWAKAIAYSHRIEGGHAGINCETGEHEIYPKEMPGGPREGAGRKPSPANLKKNMISIKLPQWLLDWMAEQNESRAVLIEEALKKVHKLKEPPPAD
jgi:hypothetical protein